MNENVFSTGVVTPRVAFLQRKKNTYQLKKKIFSHFWTKIGKKISNFEGKCEIEAKRYVTRQGI